MQFSASTMSRRALLASGGSIVAAHAAGVATSLAAAPSAQLTVASRILDVNGKPAKVFGIVGAGGKHGHFANEGDRFETEVLNATAEPLQLHWHGQVKAPYDQDRARPDGQMLATGARDRHSFELTPGTHWMHSHTLSEQRLLAAPMVTREKGAGDVQDVVMMLHDFAFRTPEEILAELGGTVAHSGHAGTGTGNPGTPRSSPSAPADGHMGGHAGMGHGMHGGQGMGRGMGMGMGRGHGMGHGMGGMGGMSHANDVSYDAYLANDRTLSDPDVVRVDKGGRVRLRIINGGTATAFHISTPGLATRCIAVDGTPCKPVAASVYPLAQGQRIDLEATLPAGGGAFPVLATVEAARFVTGLVLATAGAIVGKIAATADRDSPAMDLAFESRLAAAQSLPERPVDRHYSLMLNEEPGYRWTINGRVHGEHTPLEARVGERVALTFMNPSMMMHPMHLHGHHFQVVAIGGRRIFGALRDTIAVPGHMPVTVAFDAAQRGDWYLHCHHLYHMATGMMTEVRVS